MKKSIILCAIFAVANAGCAFMFNGGKQDVTFTTNPGHADIRNNGQFIGTGNAVATVDRASTNNVVASAPGYKSSHIYLQKKMNAGWLLWDIGTCVFPVTFCIPVLVDAVSGAWNGYNDHYAIKLEPGEEEKPQVTKPAPANTQVPGQQIIIVK